MVLSHVLSVLVALSPAQEKPVPLPIGKSDLAVLADMAAKVNGEKDWQKMRAIAEANRAEVIKLLDQDRLTTANDYLNATNAIMDPMNWYENARLNHETAVMALMYGHPDAPKKVTFTWDFLMRSLGRPQRFGAVKYPAGMEEEWAQTDPVAPVVAAVFNDPQGSRKKASSAKDSEEMRKLREDDQKARQGTMGSMTLEDIEKMAAGDKERHKRLLQIIADGKLNTGADFEAASLLLQHGGSFRDYAMAHELSLAAIILGYDKAAWLVSRTYDRMLMSVGQRQRYGTQWNEKGLRPMDPVGVGDRARLAMNTYRLEDLKKYEQAILKKMFGG